MNVPVSCAAIIFFQTSVTQVQGLSYQPGGDGVGGGSRDGGTRTPRWDRVSIESGTFMSMG